MNNVKDLQYYIKAVKNFKLFCITMSIVIGLSGLAAIYLKPNGNYTFFIITGPAYAILSILLQWAQNILIIINEKFKNENDKQFEFK